MNFRCILFVAWAIAITGCKHDSSLTPESSQAFGGRGSLTIKSGNNAYSWKSNDLGGTRTINATLKNESNITFYAMLGDGFNSSLNQINLYIAQGTDGYIEQRNQDGSWQPTPRTNLIEGTNLVALGPQQSYNLTTSLYSWRGDEAGRFRLRVEYFDRLDHEPGAEPFVDYSNVFIISDE